MYICQPPITRMDAYLGCCDHAQTYNGHLKNGHHTSVEYLVAPEGFKVRDLVSAAQNWTVKHRHCPHAPPKALQDVGTIRINIMFEGWLELHRDDPYLRRRQEIFRDRVLALEEQIPSRIELEQQRSRYNKRSKLFPLSRLLTIM